MLISLMEKEIAGIAWQMRTEFKAIFGGGVPMFRLLLSSMFILLFTPY